MYRVEDVLKKLNSDNYYIDVRALDTFIKEWQIDPIYEAKDGTIFYDDIAIFKLKKGISLKSQGYNKEQICYRINKNPIDMSEEEVEETSDSTSIEESTPRAPEVRSVGLSVTNQTLQMLAAAVADRITDDIKRHIDTSQFTEKLVEAGMYKKDNEILAKQISELVADNKKLAKRIDELEKQKKSFFSRIFG